MDAAGRAEEAEAALAEAKRNNEQLEECLAEEPTYMCVSETLKPSPEPYTFNPNPYYPKTTSSSRGASRRSRPTCACRK